MSTIDLKYPVTFEGKTFEKLTLRRLTVGDSAAADLVTGDTKKSAAVLASAAGVPINVILGLDIADFKSLVEANKDFLSDLQTMAS